jgi:hypothetical protein
MLFTVEGPTAGAILMEWNIHQTTKGSAAMWDSHFRVGGASGSKLGMAECRKTSDPGQIDPSCIAASLLLHLTPSSSAYIENMWAWVADHDIDGPEAPADNLKKQENVYAARGILIESKGPTWLHSTAAEHCVLYQYQIAHAELVFIGLAQTESPYYQPGIPINSVFKIAPAERFIDDPTDDLCEPGEPCDSYGMRILESTDVFIYGAGLYNFFKDYSTDCADNLQYCQPRIFETSYSERIWAFNLFTIGAPVASPLG